MWLAPRLAELAPGMGDTVILDLLSNGSFMGTTDDGMPSPAVHMSDGRYHVPGSLIPTPLSIVRKALQCCEGIAKVVKNSKVILVGPSPRYVSGRCCDDVSHLENYNCLDYEAEILGGVETVNRALEKWASENDLNFSLIDPTEYSAPAGFPLGERVTPDGSAWWSTADPVHLSQESYRVLASAIMGLPSAAEEAPSTVGSGSSAVMDKGRESPPSSGKRKRVDSVVTSMPAGSTGGRTPQRPAWLSGGFDSYSMGRGGGHGHRGWNPNWRGSTRSRSRSRYGRRGRQWRW
jgi:hypothetical protein